MQKFSSAGWRYPEGLETVFNTDIQNTVSTVTSLWTYRIKKSLAPRPTSLFCKAKAFLGIWTELVNLLTLQLGICGFIRLIPAWLCCYPLRQLCALFYDSLFLYSYQFKRTDSFLFLRLLHKLEYSS